MLKKCLCLVLALMMVLVNAASLADEDVPGSGGFRYSYTRTVSAGLSLSGSTAYCTGSGSGKLSDTNTYILVSLQRRASDADPWLGIKYWSATATGSVPAIVDKTCSISSGYSYRVYVICIIKDSSGNVLETVTRTSSILSN